MDEIKGTVNPDVEARFRRLAMKKYGYCKGSLTKALLEAMENWSATNEGKAAKG